MSEGKKMGRDMENMYAWRKENLKHYVLDINKKTEKDVYEQLEKQPNKKEYIVKLIRKDMEG